MHHHHRVRSICSLLLISALIAAHASEPAVQPPYSWRGINGSGVFPAGDLVHDFCDLPADFTMPTLGRHEQRPDWLQPGVRRNIVWRTTLPHWGHNTPVVMGDRVFLLCEEGAGSEAALLVSIDAVTGTMLWQGTVDHLDAWPEPRRSEAKDMRARELRRWREYMTWWNRLFWNNERNRPALHDEATWNRIHGEALAAGWEFPAFDQANRELRGAPADCGNGAYRYRYGLRFGRNMNGRPVDGSLVDNWRRVNEERIYWRPGWTSEGPFYGTTMGSVVGDGTRIYAITALGAAVAYTSDGTRLWVADLGLAPSRTGLPCHNRYYHQSIASPVLADDRLVYFSWDSGAMYGLDTATGALVWTVATPITKDDKGKESKRGYSAHMAPGGTPVVMRLGDTLVAIANHGLAVRVSDGRPLGQVSRGEDRYGSTYNSWTARGDVVYAQHGGQVFAARLSIVDNQLRQEVVWQAEPQGDSRSPNLIIHGDHLFCGPLTTNPGRRRHGLSALDAATGALVRGNVAPAGTYSTALGCDGRVIVTRTGGWSNNNSTWTHYQATDFANGQRLGIGWLANPTPEGEIKERHIGTLGSAYITWGAAGVAPWGNRIFIRNNDYLWCIGDPQKPWTPPEHYLPR